MDVQINYLAVVLAAVSSMVVGSLWYSPLLFFKQWSSLAGIKHDPSKMSQRQMAVTYGTVFLASLVTAFILAHVTYITHSFFKNGLLQDAVSTAFWLWLGFTVARVYVHDSFEARRKKLTLLTAAHELVTVIVMALIIGALGTA